jgi:hypothetical protein
MVSIHNLDPERQAQVRAPLQKLSNAMIPRTASPSGYAKSFI